MLRDLNAMNGHLLGRRGGGKGRGGCMIQTGNGERRAGQRLACGGGSKTKRIGRWGAVSKRKGGGGRGGLQKAVGFWRQ